MSIQRVLSSVIGCLLMGLAVVGVGGLGGCSSAAVYNGHDYTIDSQSADRERVIGVIREVLSGRRFVIDRVDGRRGVVTTAFKTTQGIVSPWDTEQSSVHHEAADFVNQHERSVRVTINDDDTIVVSVIVQRVHRPGWRIETESISRSTRATVIGADGLREPGRMVTPIGLDGRLAQRIGDEISKKLSSG